MAAVREAEERGIEVTRYTGLAGWQKTIFLTLATLGIAVAVIYLFGISFQGAVLVNAEYYWLFIGLFMTCVFLILPGRKKDKGIPWYDWIAAAATFGISFYIFLNAYELAVTGWKNIPLGIIIWILLMEGGRRTGGPIYLAVILILGLYPLFAAYMPGIFEGISFSFTQTITAHVFRFEGLMGIATKVVAEIILGFLVFAGVLIATGGADFFLNLAMGILGRFRGGPAKVAVLSSGFFGSLSGSVFSNIVATGSVTIPAMKKTGYPPHYAGAIEACASTGGVLMPPVMGAVAFVMCVVIGIDYSAVIVAAAIPAILYYFGLLMQVDAYAAKTGLTGMRREEIPSMKRTLIQGWPFVAVLVFLVWGLLWMRWQYMTPWYAAALMVVLSFWRKETMMTPKRLLNTLVITGRLITQTAGIILPIGFVVSGLTITGVTGSFTAGLVTLGGGNIFLVLIVGVIACYIMGMAGLSIVAYIFLAVTLAPAVVEIANLNVLATHLFIIYYAMLAGITPPVAASAFLAGTMAGAHPMTTAFRAMRLGVVIYFIPFFFVFNPALILEGPPLEALYLFILCLIGIVFIAGGVEGYLLKFGLVRMGARLPLVIAGVLIGFPEWWTTIAGAILAVVVIAIMLLTKNRKAIGEKMVVSPS